MLAKDPQDTGKVSKKQAKTIRPENKQGPQHPGTVLSLCASQLLAGSPSGGSVHGSRRKNTAEQRPDFRKRTNVAAIDLVVVCVDS